MKPFFLLFLMGGFVATSFVMIQAGWRATRHVFATRSPSAKVRALMALGVVLWALGFIGCVAYLVAAIGIGMIKADGPLH